MYGHVDNAPYPDYYGEAATKGPPTPNITRPSHIGPDNSIEECARYQGRVYLQLGCEGIYGMKKCGECREGCEGINRAENKATGITQVMYVLYVDCALGLYMCRYESR